MFFSLCWRLRGSYVASVICRPYVRLGSNETFGLAKKEENTPKTEPKTKPKKKINFWTSAG